MRPRDFNPRTPHNSTIAIASQSRLTFNGYFPGGFSTAVFRGGINRQPIVSCLDESSRRKKKCPANQRQEQYATRVNIKRSRYGFVEPDFEGTHTKPTIVRALGREVPLAFIVNKFLTYLHRQNRSCVAPSRELPLLFVLVLRLYSPSLRLRIAADSGANDR